MIKIKNEYESILIDPGNLCFIKEDNPHEQSGVYLGLINVKKLLHTKKIIFNEVIEQLEPYSDMFIKGKTVRFGTLLYDVNVWVNKRYIKMVRPSFDNPKISIVELDDGEVPLALSVDEIEKMMDTDMDVTMMGIVRRSIDRYHETIVKTLKTTLNEFLDSDESKHLNTRFIMESAERDIGIINKYHDGLIECFDKLIERFNRETHITITKNDSGVDDE